MGWLADTLFGKPKQVPPDTEPDEWGNHEEPSERVVDSTPKAPPELRVTRVGPHESGDEARMELWLSLENDSDEEVEITKIDCLGQVVNPARFLKAHERHELRVFSGPVPRSDADHKMIIQYKVVVTGDYYHAEYLIKYHCAQHVEGVLFVPTEFDLLRPIHTI